jgi:modulator of FtsH protease
MSTSAADWGNFFLAAASAAAALTGLLFVAVSLRPREIRESALMAGRARSAFYAFVTVLLVGLLELVPVHLTLVGAGQLAVAVSVLALSLPFSMAAMRTHQIRYARASVYHGGLLTVAVGSSGRYWG